MLAEFMGNYDGLWFTILSAAKVTSRRPTDLLYTFLIMKYFILVKFLMFNFYYTHDLIPVK